VQATEGVGGGFVLARAPERIAVHDILAAVDPDRTLFECAEIRRHCALFGEGPPSWSVTGMCRIHLFMQEAERALQQFLESKTLASVIGAAYAAASEPCAFMRCSSLRRAKRGVIRTRKAVRNLYQRLYTATGLPRLIMRYPYRATSAGVVLVVAM